MKNILVVGGVKDLHSQLEQRNVKYTLLMSKGDYNINFFDGAEKVFIFDFEHKESIINMMKILHEQEPFDAVVCIAEKEQKIAFEISESLDLFNTTSLSSHLTQNKHLLRELLRQNNVSEVNFQVCHNHNQLIQFASQNGFPFIVKPLDQWASIGVLKFTSSEELDSYIEKNKIESPLLAEDLLQGTEISVETFTINDHHIFLAFTEKMLHPNTFIEVGHAIPHSLSPKTTKEVEELVRKLFRLVNHTFGPAHTEIILTKDGPIIVESHTRPGGDDIIKLIELSTGINVINLLLDYQLGERPLTDYPVVNYGCFSSIRYLVTTPGKITSIDGLDEIGKIEGVYKVRLSPKVGDVVKPINNSFDRIGRVILYGSSKESIKEKVNKIDQILKITTVLD